MQETKLLKSKAIKIFEYEKKNNKYWNRAKLYQQVVKKTLPFVKALYPNYSLLFLFNNTTSHFIYTKDTLEAKNINKRSKRKEPILHDRWFDQNNIWIIYFMNFNQKNGQ